MKDKIIEAQDLTKIYKKSVRAVNGVSFSVDQGEIFGFLGPNGAGKTTTIRMLTTLASITAGKAAVAGYDVASHASEVRKSIGVVPQELTADDELKGIENLLLAAKLHHVPNEAAKKKAKELMSLLELEGAADRLVRTYSGGMRRRLQLAMGLIHSPKLLFLDEPTLGLDIQTRQKMWTYIQQLNRENGITVFVTTHYLEEADSLCNRIAIIDGGSIKQLGTPSELKAKLGGNTLRIEVDSDTDLTSFLKVMPDVSEVSKVNSYYDIKIEKTDRALPLIVDGITKKGLKISDIAIVKPTLDQVFLQVTGNGMRDGVSNGDGFAQRIMMERAK